MINVKSRVYARYPLSPVANHQLFHYYTLGHLHSSDKILPQTQDTSLVHHVTYIVCESIEIPAFWGNQHFYTVVVHN
jgi:hypothetical protein